MEINKVSLKIAGPAGEGILSAGHILAKCCSRGGLYVVTENERPSLIRGGHNEFMVRAEHSPIYSHINLVNVLLALDKKSCVMHASELSYQGAIIYDGSLFTLDTNTLGRDDLRLIGLPMRDILKSIGADKLVENAIALGACIALLEYDLGILLDVLREEYAKHPEALKLDIKAAQAGYEFVKENAQPFTNKLEVIDDAPPRMLINGLQALNLGAIKSGVSFLSQYPMTPSTGVIQGLAAQAEKYRIGLVQTEDEIASLNMAIGAAYSGARAMTATSGGGYALMNEAISLAGVTETGVVIVEVQRGGPGTGLPTRTEQSDLLFVLHSGHGEFPHIVIAPSNPQSCYTEAQRAFNLADKFQTPVTLLLDRHNAETFHTIESLPEDLPIERGERWSQSELDSAQNVERFAWSSSGVSKRIVPGQKKGLHVITGNEHDAKGLVNDDRDTRTRMMNKRLSKLNSILQELPKPVLEGDADADVTFVTWGSTYSIIKDTQSFLAEKGISSNHLQLTYMNPFHSVEVAKILSQVRRPVIVENNATAQLAQLISMRTGIAIKDLLLQYDGWPFAPEVLADRVYKLLHS